MTTVEGAPGDGLRRVVLRVHGTVLIALCVMNLIIITIGYNGGGGLYGLLPEQPLGFGGLWQAYGIMLVIGVTLWIGSFQPQPRKFDLIGLIAHVPTLFALFAFPESYAAVFDGNLAALSMPIHIGWIAVETFALLWKSSLFTTQPAKASAATV